MSFVENILLRVAGEDAGAKRTLKEVAAEAQAFARMDARAELGVDASQARRELREMEASLSRVDRRKVKPEVALKIAKAIAEAKAIDHELDKLDGRDVTAEVRVKMERGISDRMRALGRDSLGLSRDLGTAERGAGRFARAWGAIFKTKRDFGPFNASIGHLIALIPVAISLLAHLGGAAVAVVASLAQAAGGVGALAIGFGASLVPAVLLGVAAFQKFKAESGKAGTAAHALSQQLGKVGDAVKRATGPGSNAIFRGLTDAAKSIGPVISRLRGPLTNLGQSIGSTFRRMGSQLASPQWQSFFRVLTNASSRIVPQLGRAFMNFAGVLRNIARAALPLVERAVKAVADWFGKLGKKTSDIQKVRSAIREMVSHLKSWLNLLGQVGRVLGAVFKAGSGPGKDLVDTLAKGARKLADFLNSAKGQRQLHTFFKQAADVAKEFGKALGQAFKLLQQIGGLAPLKDVISGFRKVLEFVNDLLKKVPQLKPVLKAAVTALIAINAVRFLAAITGITKLIRLFRDLRGAAAGASAAEAAAGGAGGAGGLGRFFNFKGLAGFAGPIGIAAAFAAALDNAIGGALPKIASKLKTLVDNFSRDWKKATQVPHDLTLFPRNQLTNPLKYAFQNAMKQLQGSFAGRQFAIKLNIETKGDKQARAAIANLAKTKIGAKILQIAAKGGPQAQALLLKLARTKLGRKLLEVAQRGGPAAVRVMDALQHKQLGQKVLRILQRGGPQAQKQLETLLGIKLPTYHAKVTNAGARAAISAIRSVARQRIPLKQAVIKAVDNATRVINQVKSALNSIPKTINVAINAIQQGFGLGGGGQRGGGGGSSRFNPSFGLSSGLGGFGFASGGVVEAARQARRTFGGVFRDPTFLVGDHRRGREEVVISPDPAYRRQNVSYWQMAARMLGMPGFAAGGPNGPLSTPQQEAYVGIGPRSSFDLGPTSNVIATIFAELGRGLMFPIDREIQLAQAALEKLDPQLEKLQTRLDNLQQHNKKDKNHWLIEDTKTAIQGLKDQQKWLNDIIAGDEKVKAFTDSINQLRQSLRDLVEQAVSKQIDINLAIDLSNIQSGPVNRELQSLLGEQAADAKAREDQDITDRLAKARADQGPRRFDETEADAAERIAQAQADEKQALDDQSQLARQRRIDELQATVDAATQAANDRADVSRAGFDAETNSYRDMLNQQFDDLTDALAQHRITYAEYVRDVNYILQNIADPLVPDADTELAIVNHPDAASLYGDPRPSSSSDARDTGRVPVEIKRHARGFVTAGRSILHEVGEVGREALLPLTRDVMREIGSAVALQMPMVPAVAGGFSRVTSQTSRDGDRYEIVMPPPTVPYEDDGRRAAANLALQLRQRGGLRRGR